VRTDPVVVPAPSLDQDLRLAQAVKDLAVEQLVPELAVERLAVAVLPRAARLDEQGPDAEPPQPFADRAGDELGAVVGADVLRQAPRDEQLGQDLEGLVRAEPAARPGSPGTRG
jgi:hypothetical protein